MTEKTMTPPGYSGALLAMLADSPQRRANAVADVAKLMRQRADAAFAVTPWPGGDLHPGWMADTYELTDHIKAMAQPTVAVFLANWLEDCAARYRAGQVIAVSEHAVALCRAYLAAEEGA